MTQLIYSALTSLDGFIEDATGNFDWYTPSDEVHQFINDLERSAGTYLLGRRMYETLLVWETDPNLIAHSPVTQDYAQIWQSAQKIVFSTTLPAVSTTRTRLERSFDPTAIRQLKATAGSDLTIGGPNLAAHAFQSGLVDECHLFLIPILVGSGKRALPKDLRLELSLLDEHHFTDGVVFLRYRVGPIGAHNE